MKPSLSIFAATLILLVAVSINFRHQLLIWAISDGQPPPLLPAQEESPGVVWMQDYFTVQALNQNTYAIGEPRYHQQNYSYLLLGDSRALLFDAGPGLRDIRGVAESLTDLPITFVPSHFHFDHTGNRIRFEHVAVVDLPYLRARAPDNRLALRWSEHMGSAEGFELPVLEVDEWLAPGSLINLGGRRLQVLYTPGHTEDSISLLDLTHNLLFSGDFIYPGPLIAFLPNSSLPAYRDAAAMLLAAVPGEADIYGAHRSSPPGAPRQKLQDVSDLHRSLQRIEAGEQSGEGVYPVIYPVNDQMTLWAEPAWLQDW